MSGVPVLSLGAGDEVLAIGAGDEVLALGPAAPAPSVVASGPLLRNYATLGPADFEDAIAQRLLPRGLAWTRLAGSLLQRFWRAIADAVAALHGRAGALTEVEAFPPTSVELLPDWERVLGLPDPCLGTSPTTAARQASVAARLAATGGQAIPYFAALAAQLGTTIEVTEYAPFRAGIDVAGAGPDVISRFEADVSTAMSPLWTLSTNSLFAGGQLRDASWAHAWLVTIVGASFFYFEAGVSSAGEPLWQLSGNAAACEIARLAPAHTLVMFTAAAGTQTSLGTTGPLLSDLGLADSGAYAT